MSDDWLTVAEAAERLSISESSLRRLLAARPDLSRHQQQTQRQTKTGRRFITMLPVSLLESLQEALGTPSEPRQNPVRTARGTASEVEFLREQLRVKDAQMGEKDRQIAALQAHLEGMSNLIRAEKEEKARLMQERSLPLLPEPENVFTTASEPRQNGVRNGFWRKLLRKS